MTIIAWHREKGIAVDSQCSGIEGCNKTVTKYRIVDGVLYAGAGKAGVIERLFECIVSDTVITFDIENVQMIAFKFETDVSPVEVKRLVTGSKRLQYTAWVASAAYDAVGSGATHAIAVLAYGKNPAAAVESACKYDVGCGGEIHYFDVLGNKIC